MSAPKYWGSWKGQVLSAIATDGARTWSEIRDATDLNKSTLNKVLSELYHLDLISKSGQTYRIEDKQLYREYRNHSRESTPRRNEDLVKYITDFAERNKVPFTPESSQLYLTDDLLDRLSKDLITQAKTQVQVVNPFVDKCTLSDKLREAAKTAKVQLVTRPPDQYKQKYHITLQKSNIQLFYNDSVHAKLVTIDHTAAIVSSMNLYSGSSAGKSWEAGIITHHQPTVNQVTASINHITQDQETTKI